MNGVKFKKLCGKHVLSGVERDYASNDAECIKFILDNKIYRAIEDPADGYRSCCERIEINGNINCQENIPPTKVVVSLEDSNDRTMLHFYEEEGGTEVLAIGTDYSDACYPICVFRYQPENLPMNRHKPKRSVHR